MELDPPLGLLRALLHASRSTSVSGIHLGQASPGLASTFRLQLAPSAPNEGDHQRTQIHQLRAVLLGCILHYGERGLP